MQFSVFHIQTPDEALGECFYMKIGLGAPWAPPGRPLGALWAPLGCFGRPLGAPRRFGRPLGAPSKILWAPLGRPFGRPKTAYIETLPLG